MRDAVVGSQFVPRNLETAPRSITVVDDKVLGQHFAGLKVVDLTVMPTTVKLGPRRARRVRQCDVVGTWSAAVFLYYRADELQLHLLKCRNLCENEAIQCRYL